MPEIIIIAHNIRSTYNVGSIFRSSEGFGVSRIILSGYTPYPDMFFGGSSTIDARLPHIRNKITQQIQKTALGAEQLVPFEYCEYPNITELINRGYRIVGLEQHARSINLRQYIAPERVALLVGEEVHGIPPVLIDSCEDLIEISMMGNKESFNVSVATGIALYALTT